MRKGNSSAQELGWMKQPGLRVTGQNQKKEIKRDLKKKWLQELPSSTKKVLSDKRKTHWESRMRVERGSFQQAKRDRKISPPWTKQLLTWFSCVGRSQAPGDGSHTLRGCHHRYQYHGAIRAAQQVHVFWKCKSAELLQSYQTHCLSSICFRKRNQRITFTRKMKSFLFRSICGELTTEPTQHQCHPLFTTLGVSSFIWLLNNFSLEDPRWFSGLVMHLSSRTEKNYQHFGATFF